MLDDADIVYAPGVIQKLALEARLLNETPFNFLSVPAIYLAKGPSERILTAGKLTTEEETRLLSKMLIESPLQKANGENVQHYVPASGILIARKETLLSVGAYDESFAGWGGEDRDLIYRLMLCNQNLQRPRSFYATINTNMNRINTYEGWRALFRVHGDYLAAKGIYGFHLFHEPMAWKSSDTTRENIDKAAAKANQLAASNLVLPYVKPGVRSEIILGTNPHLANTQVYAALRNPTVVPENTAIPAREFAHSLAATDPEAVVLWNPYAFSWRLEVFNELKRLGTKVLVGERGALPWSLYFDDDISITSMSYREELWNRSNSKEEDERVEKYISELRFGDAALERQNGRTGAAMVRHASAIHHDTKILFIPLQLETDTVTVHFSEPGRSYSDYIAALRELQLRLPMGWVLAYKNHPLNMTKTEFPGAICFDQVHINDALEACDAVALFNSGTGIISMLFDKPVFYYGPTFYGIEGVNSRFISASQLSAELERLFTVDKVKVRRFLRYLTEEFYSFADWRVENKKAPNGKALVPKLRYLHFKNIRIPGRQPVEFEPACFLSPDSILMDRFRMPPSTPAKGPENHLTSQKHGILANSGEGWGLGKSTVHALARYVLSPALSTRDRDRLAHQPVDFFKKAKWGPNRFFGRMLLTREQRPY